MIIQAPLNPKTALDIEKYADLGADEFYLGYVNKAELSSQILSRRGGCETNFSSVETAGQAVLKIKKRNKKVFITINEHFYPEDYFEQIIRDVGHLINFGADGFIITDINLFLRIKKEFPSAFLIASTGTHITNSAAVRFFAAMGVKRVVLPRSLSSNEIIEISQENKDTAFEIFAMNEKCPNIDGRCCYVHEKIGERHYGQACKLIKPVKLISKKMPDFREYSCGVCELYKLKDLSKLILKIAGRTTRFNNKIRKDILFIKRAILSLNNAASLSEHIDLCKAEYKKVYGFSCKNDCYY